MKDKHVKRSGNLGRNDTDQSVTVLQGRLKPNTRALDLEAFQIHLS